MGLEDIKEVKECQTPDEVNGFLSQGNWRLIETKIEKLKVPVGKEQIGRKGTTYKSGAWHEDVAFSAIFEIKYAEELRVIYVVGRYE